MKIFVMISLDKTVTLNVQASDTVAAVKEKLQDKEGIPRDQQLLLFAGFEIADTQSLKTCFVQNGSTLYLASRIPLSAVQKIHTTAAALAMAQQRAEEAERLLHLTEQARSAWAAEALSLGWGQHQAAIAPSEDAVAAPAEDAANAPAEDALAAQQLSRRQKKRHRQSTAKELYGNADYVSDGS